MIVDELILKLQADLADVKKKLAQVEGDAAKAGKNAGEAMGKAAGKGFDSRLKSDVDKTLKDVQGKAESSGSALSGIFGKVGGAIAVAFALDKVVGFFKDSMKYAAEMQEEMGGVSQATKDINDDFEKMSKNGLGFWNSLKLAVGTALNNIVTGLKSIAVYVNDAFNGKSNDRIIELYNRQKVSLQSLGDEMNKLSSINNRTATEELKLIELKEQLSARAKALGLDYDELTKSGMSYLKMLELVAERERNKAKKDIYSNAQGELNKAADKFNQAGVLESENERLKSGNAGNLALYGNQAAIDARIKRNDRLALELKASGEQYLSKYQETINRLDLKQAEEEKKSSGGAASQDRGNEARFLDSALRLKTIQKDLEYTIKKAKADLRNGAINQEEFYRRTNDGKDGGPLGTAHEEARQATEYELNSLRVGFAQYIEDRHTATMLAITTEADNARKMSYELLEAELGQADENEEKIQAAKEANAKRLSKISQSEAIKTATAYAESFGRTMQAANATTTGIAQLAKAKDIGSGLSAGGSVLGGLSGLKEFAPALGVLGPIGAGIGALGGIFTTIFGDSEAKRAEAARQQAERDAAALKVLQNQEKYQKDLLEFQKAQANLPFKDLQRELRIIDIQAQQKRLQGTPGDQVEIERLQRTSGAINSVIQTQADKFTGGVFFNNSARSAEALSAALGDVDRYSPSMNLLSSIMSEVAATRGESAEKVGFDFYNTRLAKVSSLDLPPQLKQAAMDFITSVAAAGFYRVARDNGINDDYDLVLARGGMRSSYGADIFRAARGYESALGGRGINTSTVNVDNMLSEFQADAGMIENLLGLFEKLNQTNLQIQDNTKKTADNTAKALELRPDRERSFIDVGLGFIQSLGQRISPSAIGIAQGIARQNLTLPTSIGTATATSSLARTLQERMADAMEIQVAQGERANQLLDGILRATIELYRVMDGNSGTVSTFDDAAATAYLADRKRRAY